MYWMALVGVLILLLWVCALTAVLVPLYQREVSLSVHTKTLPVHTKAVPVHTNLLPVHTKSFPVHTKSLPVHTKSLPAPIRTLPVHTKSLPNTNFSLQNNASASRYSCIDRHATLYARAEDLFCLPSIYEGTEVDMLHAS
ncbi:sulfotransferase [Plakobranchus ocellatus]|uniref:Sulfotransferase n=1 Tax=Plakobranchus ocellatus TaxID=259542 RepID=A0AAV3Z3T3_9GAST|nr:sulfotransferase [Plakobranchus ocellatus]